MRKRGKRFMWLWLEARYLYSKTMWQTGRMDRLEAKLDVIRNDLNYQKARLQILGDVIETALKAKKEEE